MKVLFCVTHLLGTGHLSRVLTLARAFVAQGHSVTVVTGGMPAPHLAHEGIDVIQLPPVRSDGVDFSTLLDADGTPASATYLDTRAQVAIDALTKAAPDALITELYPFGRKSLKAEFTRLLDAATGLTKRPVIMSSIRDILAPPRKPKKAERAQEAIDTFYDAVLVHSDKAITPLSASWPVTPALDAKLHYTGFVTSPLPALPGAARGTEVLVSVGGGSVGAHVFDAALGAARLSDLRWRLLVGGANAQETIARLRKGAPDNAIVEAVRPDFRQLLQTAACSVSLCGYNTALDILQARCPAVFVPFDEGVEVEQGLRADSLANRSGITVLRKADLTAETLLAEVTAAMTAPQTQGAKLHMDGAQQAAALTQALVQGGRDV